MEKGLTGIITAAGVCASLFGLTAFAPHHGKLPRHDERAYKMRAMEVALLCGSNDPKNPCYGRQMAKWLEKHGYKQKSQAMMAALPKKFTDGN